MSAHFLASPTDDTLRQLAALGRAQLRSSLVGKVDLSGVVQQALLDAHAAGDKFPAGDPAQARAWLTAAFLHKLTDAIRWATAWRRDARRDVPIDVSAGSNAAPLIDLLPADASTPSGRAVRAEEAGVLARALAGLNPDQRRAVEWRYLHGRSVREIADALGRSKEAVAGLLKRGLEQLRGRLADPDAAG
jgi:RNA polymerase sigma-70 factor, ECF subfamily